MNYLGTFQENVPDPIISLLLCFIEWTEIVFCGVELEVTSTHPYASTIYKETKRTRSKVTIWGNTNVMLLLEILSILHSPKRVSTPKYTFEFWIALTLLKKESIR